jgi:hypothetical protein
MSEVRRQRSEDRGQKTEGRRQIFEVGGGKWDPASFSWPLNYAAAIDAASGP